MAAPKRRFSYLSRLRSLSWPALITIVLAPVILVAVSVVRHVQQRKLVAQGPTRAVQLPAPRQTKQNLLTKTGQPQPSPGSKKSLGRSRIPGPPILAPQAENEFEGDLEERRNWFIFQRQFPFDELPEEARLKAWESRPMKAPAGDGTEDYVETALWQSIGPMPTNSYFPSNWGKTSGRINAIAVSPANANLVLIGAATGGVWRSTDAGTTFTPVSDNQVDLAVGSIAFAPSNPSIVYAGMGDKDAIYLGTGVLRSTDGGQTWARVSNSTLPPLGMISQVLVDANDPNRVYVAQARFSRNNGFAQGGFYYSTDGGVNWTKTLSGTARDLVRHPTQTATFYLAVTDTDAANGFSGGVFKTTNSGQNWSRVYTSPFGNPDNIKIAVTPAAPENVYVVSGKSQAQLDVSTNGGASWASRGAGFDTGQFWYNCYLFVHPTTPNTIYVGTRDLWRTTNGGTSYSNITGNFAINGNYSPNVAKAHPDQHHFYISPSNPNTIYIANDGGLWKSTDGAATFTSLNSTLSLTMFTSYDLHPTDATRSYGGTQDNGTQKRTGGATWREFATGDGGQSFVDPLDPTIVYATYITHTVFRYSSNGDSGPVTIGNVNTFNNDRVAFYPPFVGNEVNSNLYFGTYRLYISTNRGASWTTPGGFTDLTANGGVLSEIAVAKSNINFIYTGSSDGRVMLSTNGGVTWTDRTFGLPQRFIKSITISPTDPNTAYVTVSGFGSGHVFKTTNAGVNWTNISGNLPDIPTNDLLIDPRAGNSNTIYAGTDIGMFRSTAGGITWETFNSGLPPTIISEIDAQPTGIMQVGTYGRGAFEINLNQTANVTVQFSSSTYSVNENGGSATITVTRAGTTTGAVSVNFATSNGTATAGQDYTANSGTLNFAAGEITKTFPVAILDDSAIEGSETINLTLGNPTGGAVLGSPSSAVLTINDNEGNCTYSLNPTSQSFGSAGGTGSFTVTTATGCAWSAVSNAQFVTTTSSGSGNGTVNYSVASNSGAARTGSITVGGQTFTVNQNAAGGCPATTITAGQTINGTLTTSDCFFTGTSRWVDVYNFSGTAGQQIAITMTSSTFDTYLYLLNSSNQLLTENDDSGSGTDSRIPVNSGFFTLPSTGSYTIYATSYSADGVSGSTGSYAITLLSASCSYGLNPTSQSFGASGGSSLFNVTTTAGCAWTAVSNATWISTSSSGSGNGTVNYTVAANSGSARTGTITVNGQLFTVNQSGGGTCPATSISVGQTVNGNLTTSDCFFSGTSRYVDVYTFTGSAGQQIAISMDSGVFDTYLYLLNPSNQTILQDDDGGVGTNSRIPAVSGFFTLPSTGTYTIYATSFSFDGFTGSVGSYTLNLAGVTNCSFSLNPTSQSFGSAGGTGSFTVTTSAGCAWSAASNAGWITTNSSGSGTGTAGYIVASNNGAARSGSITVGGQVFTINQSAASGGCPSTTIAAGQTISGTLTTSDCYFTGTTRWVDVYNFSGTAGQQISITMTSSTFDTYLYLLNSSNQLITENDDSGGGTNSRIPVTSGSFTLPSTGTYTIYATSYSFDGLIGATGSYSISLSNVNSSSNTIQFSAGAYSATESSGSVVVTVTRLGDVSGSASANYATSDIAGLQSCTVVNGRASERCDYVTSVGTVRFGPGETSKTITIPFVDDVNLEGNETFTISLNGASGATLASPSTASVMILENDVIVPATNPVDGVDFFVRQQYLDFLNRQPDPVGFQNWVNTLGPCPNGGFGEPTTSDCDRLHVAAGFFQSDEFLNRGYWAFRFYMVSYDQRPTYAQFVPDMAQVGGPKSPAEEEASKAAFADAFVQRPEFLARYGGLNGQAFANALLATAGLPSNTFIVTGGMTNGQILRGVVETNAVLNRFLTEGTVSIQYFGFLRRDPDTIGYQNNVNTLNANPSNLRHMIFIFIYSTEYRSRFGPQ